jgi:ribosome-binding protein aMBF1 (putative translation factor)
MHPQWLGRTLYDPLLPSAGASFIFTLLPITVTWGTMIMQAAKTFRRRLRKAMEENNISQRELAKRAKTGYSGINRILQGEQTPTLEVADRLADAVGKTLTELLPKKNKLQDSSK